MWHLLSESYGPVDRLIELGVLAIIAYEAIHAVIDRKRISRRKTAILGLMGRGQSLLDSVPTDYRSELVDGWAQQGERWIKDAQTLLAAYSSQALGSFNHLRLSSFNYPNVSAGAHSHFKVLMARMENLRGIMEKPEVCY